MLDFWVVHGRKYDVLALYQYGSIYHYWNGINWRAWVAFLVGIAPSLPGLINSVNTKINPGVGIRPYEFGWILGFVATGLVYIILMFVFRPEETFIDKAVLPDDIYAARTGTIEGVVSQDEETLSWGAEGEKKAGWKQRMYHML